MLDPLPPTLILPEVRDAKQWRGGEHEYIDPEPRFLVMTQSLFATLFVNPNAVKQGDMKSYKDLLQPRWKGKIIADDPTSAGPGLATFTFFYLHPDLGPNFIRALGKQELVFLIDYAQEVDGIIKGKYPVLIGGSEPRPTS
jgi:iron(III) transport system substrate-binding protein